MSVWWWELASLPVHGAGDKGGELDKKLVEGWEDCLSLCGQLSPLQRETAETHDQIGSQGDFVRQSSQHSQGNDRTFEYMCHQILFFMVPFSFRHSDV